MLQFGLGIVMPKKETKAKVAKVREIVELNPIITATSVAGRFEITDKALALLGLKPDSNIMFVSNYDQLLAAIENGMESLVEDCIEQGFDIKSGEGVKYLFDKYGVLYVTEGIERFKSDGTNMLAKPKKTKAELEEYLASQRTDLIVAKRTEIESRLVESGVISQIGEATEEQLLAEVNIKDVEVPFENARFGSKMSAISGSVQGTRTFTDSHLYKQLNVPEGHKMIFNIVSESEQYDLSNGFDNVTVPIYKLVLDKVMEVQKRVRKAKDVETSEEVVESEVETIEQGLFDDDNATDDGDFFEQFS